MMRSPERKGAGTANASPDLSEENASPDAISKYTQTSDAATITTFPRKWKAQRSRAAHRRAELIRLFVGRRQLGLRVDPNLAAWVLAATLGAAEPGPYKVAGRKRFIRWWGLDIGSLRHSIEAAQLGDFSDTELSQILKSIERGHAEHGPNLMSATKCGALLQVTAAERELFALRTIEGVDESREQRCARQAEARKARDAERKRAERGCVPRELYEANSISAVEPWKGANCSRATYYRRLKREAETSVSADVLSIQGERTDLSHDPSEGPASTVKAIRSLGAGGHSPGAQVIALAASRPASAAASDGADWLDDGDLVPAVEIPAPGEAEIPPLLGQVARIVALAERASEIDLGDRHLRATTRMCGLGLRIANEIGADHASAQAEIVARELEAMLRPHANDDRISAIIDRLAA